MDYHCSSSREIISVNNVFLLFFLCVLISRRKMVRAVGKVHALIAVSHVPKLTLPQKEPCARHVFLIGREFILNYLLYTYSA